MKLAKMYITTAYDTAFLTERGVQVASKMTVLSTQPLVDDCRPFEEALGEEARKEPYGLMLAAAGMQFVHRLTGAATIAMMNGPNSGKTTTSTPFHLLAKTPTIFHDVDYMPEIAMETLLPGEPLEFVEMEREAVRQHTMALARTNADRNREYGLPESESDSAEVAGSEERMDAFERAAAMPVVPGGLETAIRSLLDKIGNRKPLDGTTMRFVPGITATDFPDSVLAYPDGRHEGMHYVRVMHTKPPQWVDRTDDDPPGYGGAWVFPRAILGEHVEDRGDGSGVVQYGVIDGLKVLVRSASGIVPAGLIALPVKLWNYLEPGEPATTLSEEEAGQYAMTHLLVPTEGGTVQMSPSKN